MFCFYQPAKEYFDKNKMERINFSNFDVYLASSVSLHVKDLLYKVDLDSSQLE